MPIDKEFNGSVTLTTGYEIKVDPEQIRNFLNHLSLAIVGELSNKHLFRTETPSSDEFQKSIFEEINHIMTTQVPDPEMGSILFTHLLVSTLMDRFFVDMVGSIHLPAEIKDRFLTRDWGLFKEMQDQQENAEVEIKGKPEEEPKE